MKKTIKIPMIIATIFSFVLCVVFAAAVPGINKEQRTYSAVSTNRMNELSALLAEQSSYKEELKEAEHTLNVKIITYGSKSPKIAQYEQRVASLKRVIEAYEPMIKSANSEWLYCESIEIKAKEKATTFTFLAIACGVAGAGLALVLVIKTKKSK